MSTTEIHCRCGAVQLSIAGDPIVQLYCHCEDCRAAHAAAYVAASVYPSAAVSVVKGAPKQFAVKDTPRSWCTECGTYLYSQINAVDIRSVNAFLLPEGTFKPQFHVQCQHAVRPVVDALPHFKAFPAAFGGSDERVSW